MIDQTPAVPVCAMDTTITRAALLDDSILIYRKRLDEAIGLIELGARSGLVVQLTGLDKATVTRLIREVTGESSAPGQSPYTDTWYRRDHWRMAHASIVWRVHKRLRAVNLSDADLVIDTHRAYCMLVNEPLLDLTYTAFVPQLLSNGTWCESHCAHCGTPFVTPTEGAHTICPGCYILYRHRCSNCGTKVDRDAAGRYPTWCKTCGAHRVDGIWAPPSHTSDPR
jgi:DNA-directed RNA polymerase subunit RPC12/RpoP